MNQTSKQPYLFTTDNGHGWLRVTIAELSKLGIAKKVSAFSYMRAGFAYLEEDLDLGLFVSAKYPADATLRSHIEQGLIVVRTIDGESKIRGFDHYCYAEYQRTRRNTNRREQNAVLRELCGTSARAAREDMGL
jgi:hypothetical protein